MSTLAFPALLLVFFRAFESDWRRVLCLAVAAFAVSFLLRLSSLFFAMNSMIGLRSTLPTLVAAAVYAIGRRRVRTIATGIMLGVSLFLSTEQGLAVTAAYAIVGFVAALRREDRRAKLIEWGATLAIAVLTLMVALTCVAGITGARGALRYNFRLVPMDQYWYFGAPPNTFVPSWGAGFRMLFAAPHIGLPPVLAIAAAVYYLRRFWGATDAGTRRWSISLAMLLAYGAISCTSLLGVFTLSYVEPCERILLLVALLELSRFAAASDAREGRRGWLGSPRAVTVVALGVTAWAFASIPLLRAALATSVPAIVVDYGLHHERFGVNGIWPETLREAQAAIDSHREAGGRPPTLWSTYSGWIEARNGIFNPSFDYVIHALGPANRRKYLETFRAQRPELVQTVRPSYTQYEPWIENDQWAFYDALLDWYDVSSRTPWSFFWERRATPAPAPQFLFGMRVPPNLPAVQLPPIPDSIATPVMLLEVDVEYEIHNPLHVLPIVGALPRYLVGISGASSALPISLDPYVSQTRFPLVIRAGERPTLSFATASLLPGASWQPVSIDVYLRRLPAANQVWLSDLFTRLSLRGDAP
ncbi:MAG TPA: hypothetical protein VHB25_19115 [Gemmatimonadaceae bacterium]|nr:hypothetical protein [Gemmatimonadaceae bacterium]